MWDFSTLKFACSRGRSGIDAQNPSDEELLERRESARKLKESLFAAISVSWDENRVTVLCPFCKKTHKHGIDHFASDHKTGKWLQDSRGWYTYDGPSPTRCHARLAHCDHDDELRGIPTSYTILFPFEKDSRVAGLSFEIDKSFERFRTVGLGMIPPSRVENLESCYGSETYEERELQRAMQETSLLDGNHDAETSSQDVDHDVETPLQDGDYDIVTKFEMDGVENHIIQRASTYIESCAVRGDLDSLQQYLKDSPDSSSLVKMKSGEGETLLVLAVPNGHLKIVKYLLERGCNVNAADIRGRTPLMESALWGRPQILNVLLKAGANKLLQDRYGMTADNLAEESDRNDLERHKRNHKYAEDPYVKKKHRLFIRALLRHGPGQHCSSAVLPRSGNFQEAHFYKSQSAGTISLILPTQGVSIRTQAKTAAVLLRGGAFPPIVAVSGWSGLPTIEFLSPEAGLERLNEGYWAFEALRVASDIGFKFEEHYRDLKEFPGIYYACHAEAQLMSLFVRRNYIFRHYEEGESGIEDDFLQLFILQQRNTTAEILISNSPCASCQCFKQCILERIGIHFTLQELEVKT